MIPVLTAEDVRRQDAESGIPVERSMENAGRAVAQEARRMMGGCYGKRVVVVCGKGNNAGDGLVAARALHQMGATVSVSLLFERDQLNELSEIQLSRFRGRVVDVYAWDRELERADLVVDAIFGVGLTRAPDGNAAEAIYRINEARFLDRRGAVRGTEPDVTERIAVLSIDVPSGVDADTGAVIPYVRPEGGLAAATTGAVHADVTVTFSGTKPGLHFAPGAGFAGRIEIADIGIPGWRASAIVLEEKDVRDRLVRRSYSSHKRNTGTVLVVAGSRAMPGAAALVAGASMHAGAGLTVLCAPEEVCQTVVARLPEVTTIPIPVSAEGVLDLKALDPIRSRLSEADAMAVGPGLTTHPATREFVRALMTETSIPVVLDADGINAFAGDAHALRARAGFTVVTPHGGELSRLLGVDAPTLSADRMRYAKLAAIELDACVVFKGPGTVIATGDGVFINPTGGAALAQGGTGDVLTGLLAAVLAQFERTPLTSGVVPTSVPSRVVSDAWRAHAVAAGVWLHGRAADRIAARIAPHPANASTLIDELGPTLHEVFA